MGEQKKNESTLCKLIYLKPRGRMAYYDLFAGGGYFPVEHRYVSC